MSAAVESMFYVSNESNQRFVPWHGLGQPIEEAPTSHDALIYAGLDWEVESREIKDSVSGLIIPGYKANVRATDDSVLGIVRDRYQIVQNRDAFAFTDSLLGESVKYETAGSLFEGKVVWMLARLDSVDILGDEVIPYMCFTNSHDTSSAIRCCLTPTRVVCANTLNVALNGATRCWSTKHVGDISSKMEEARMCLSLGNKYMSALVEDADKLANTTVSDEQVNKIIELVFPIAPDATDRTINSIKDCREDFMRAYNAEDIKKFQGTAWGVVNAAADYADHYSIRRQTKNSGERLWSTVMGGHPILDNVYKLVA